MYHKIDLSPNPVFQRWRAYLKRWSVISSLSLNKTKGRHIVVKNCTTTKPYISRFVSFYVKRLRVNGRISPTSVKMYAKQSLLMLASLTKGKFPLNYIYPHKTYSKHMFVFVILFYHIKIQKSIVRCTRSCTPDIFLRESFIFFCRRNEKAVGKIPPQYFCFKSVRVCSRSRLNIQRQKSCLSQT